MSGNPQIPRDPKAIFLSHGGGPLPVLGDPGHQEMVRHLNEIAATTRRPSAVVVVSAHWEEPVVTITAGGTPSLIYDYYGFPQRSYSIEYPAPGAPDLAANLQRAFERNGVHARLDHDRGFDHGLFIPLLLMYPDADIPCVQVSLLGSLDPAAHIRVGASLSGVLAEDCLLIGSGFSFHNLPALMGHGAGIADPDNLAFEQWLIDTCSNRSLDERERSERLVQWTRAPGARYCHPREEHLLPLHVCYGYAGRASRAQMSLTIMNKRASTFFW